MISAFYSDPHFGHKKIIEYAKRPFADLWEMHQELIGQYKLHVKPTDTVLWCGDCFFMSKQGASEILRELPGTKLLVAGNHDKSPAAMAEIGFTIVTNELRLHIGGRTAVVSHFPYAGNVMSDSRPEQRFLDRRPKRIQGEVLVHGHTHSSKRRHENQIHVGVDAWGYRPALWHEVEELVRQV